MDSPLVSVIIPCYNASKYVEQAVRSVMEQTYQNLEIICCDDCSTDNTLEILGRLASEDSRIKVIKNAANLKIVKTLNELIAVANGKYIARMDADDISLSERIEKQVSFLEDNQDFVMCGTNAFHINEDGIILGKTHLPISYESNRVLLPLYSTIYHPTVLINAKILKEELYSDQYPYAEDYELWTRLVFNRNLKLGNLPDYLFKYRVFNLQSCSVHRQEQIQSCGKVISNFTHFSDIEKKVVINICWQSDEKIELFEITKIVKKINRLGMSSVEAYKKILLYIKRNYNMFVFLCYALNPIGIVTLCNIIVNKLKR